MGIEIERKFLVRDDGWKQEVSESERLRDGLLAWSGGRKVRVRISGGKATLTVKGRRRGPSRSEFEYDIPLDEAEQMLAEFCRRPGQLIEKTRHIIPCGALKWEVDVFHGLLSGVVTAEIELPSPDADFPRPGWLGEEVTGSVHFSTRRLLRDRLRPRWMTGVRSMIRTMARRLPPPRRSASPAGPSPR